MCANRLSRSVCCLIVLCSSLTCVFGAEELRVDKIEPPNWWVGMKHNRVELMVVGRNLHDASARFADPRLRVTRTISAENTNYLFVEFEIPDDIPPGNYPLSISKGDVWATLDYPLLPRVDPTGRHQGFNSRDAVYLITPDRFANGDTQNDQVEGMLDDFDPTQAGKRHGGDLQGIIDHLDYLQDLGVTAIWLNPVLENNGIHSYHGYKATDLYSIDPRFGSNATYQQLVQEAHRHGIKVIFDHVSNHVGLRHPWIRNLPADDWLNGSVENHLSGKHYLLSVTDPHANDLARRQLKTFWFVDRMPDLNQRNPRLARYLIQNSIWWIEYSGIDGIREDTYPYADQAFLSDWAKAIGTEYPDFSIVGEIWATKSAYIARFQDKTIFPRDFETHLPVVMDFPLMEAFHRFLSGTGKLRDIYAVYAQDFLYADPNSLLVFADNHDTPRVMFHADGDIDRVKVVLTLVLTARGIPQLLYGTEIGMVGGQRHVELRADFPGGFPDHPRTAFSEPGRTPSENEMHAFVRKLLRLRREYAALTDGKMIHVAPTWNRDVYMLMRVLGDQQILVVANGHDERRIVDCSDLIPHGRSLTLRDLLSGEVVTVPGREIAVPPMSARVLMVVP